MRAGLDKREKRKREIERERERTMNERGQPLLDPGGNYFSFKRERASGPPFFSLLSSCRRCCWCPWLDQVKVPLCILCNFAHHWFTLSVVVACQPVSCLPSTCPIPSRLFCGLSFVFFVLCFLSNTLTSFFLSSTSSSSITALSFLFLFSTSFYISLSLSNSPILFLFFLLFLFPLSSFTSQLLSPLTPLPPSSHLPAFSTRLFPPRHILSHIHKVSLFLFLFCFSLTTQPTPHTLISSSPSLLLFSHTLSL
ncbi:MAG: hypothetical protein JOS17DRAFT_609380 [Linnemannia elongata]|nr:MAG: hypothetical protein JOS17DRAFT_609380 [Linnemannia elongata]